MIQEANSISENLSAQIKHVQPMFGIHPANFIYQREDAYSSSNVRRSFRTKKVPRSVNLTAGYELLGRNQSIWRNIRGLNEKNACLAAELDVRIIDAMETSEQQLTSITDLNLTLSVLPSIVDQLKTTTEMIEEINSNMSVVERKLMELEDLLDVLNLQERQLDRRFDMAMYKEHKMADLEKVREQLTTKHAENVVKHERNLKQVQKERQLVFQDAFQDDLKYFKETGNVHSKFTWT